MKTIAESDFSKPTFLKEYSDHIFLDKKQRTLKLVNLKLQLTQSHVNFLYNLSRIGLSYNKGIEVLILENIECDDVRNLDLDTGEKLIIKNCSISGDYEFHSSPKELEIIGSNIPEFNFTLDARSVLISKSTVGTISVSSYDNEGPRVKAINIQGGSTIKRIKGLHWLLENDSSTVVIFSQDSKVLLEPETSYRVMRLIANKFGDVVQSHIFHTNAVELYAAHADKDTQALLFLEKWTNNFGRSIFLPLFWMFCVNSAFLVSFLLFSSEFSMDSFWDYIVSVINVSPLSSFISEDVSKTSWEFSFDSIRRVLLAALTYQIIVSARRFSFVKR